MPIPWGAVGKVLAHFWRELAIVVLMAMIWWKNDTIGDLKAEAEGWNTAVKTLKKTLENNDQAIRDCEQINAENDAEITRLENVNAVEIAAAEARADRAEADIQEFYDNADHLRGTDATCRTLDDALPDAILDGLRDPAADRSH